jgi:hypothetical protein
MACAPWPAKTVHPSWSAATALPSWVARPRRADDGRDRAASKAEEEGKDQRHTERSASVGGAHSSWRQS